MMRATDDTGIERDAQQRRMSAAERMRLSRERRREGLVGVVPLEVFEHEVAALIGRGLLAAADKTDRPAIANAIGRLLERVLGPWPCLSRTRTHARRWQDDHSKGTTDQPLLACPTGSMTTSVLRCDGNLAISAFARLIMAVSPKAVGTVSTSARPPGPLTKTRFVGVATQSAAY
jgi:hypothetical protein